MEVRVRAFWTHQGVQQHLNLDEIFPELLTTFKPRLGPLHALTRLMLDTNMYVKDLIRSRIWLGAGKDRASTSGAGVSAGGQALRTRSSCRTTVGAVTSSCRCF